MNDGGAASRKRGSAGQGVAVARAYGWRNRGGLAYLAAMVQILALTKYGSQAASTRQRFVQYEPYLREAGMQVRYQSLLGDDHIRRLAQGRTGSPVAVGVSYLRRIATLVAQSHADLIWIQCELFPYVPGAAELLATWRGRPIVYDFDDAIFHQYDNHRSPLVRRVLGRKLEPLLSRAAACCCGNPYLRDYAARFCPDSHVLPTVVDIDAYRPVEEERRGSPTIGWIGTASTWPYVRPLLPLLAELHARTGARLRAVGAGHAADGDGAPFIDFVPWTEANEIADVQAMDIGIMPLTDDPWSRGKSGYKLIQYMGCGLPVVASPVGVNRDIVRPGVNGQLVTDMDGWRAALEDMIGSAERRRTMGAAGREDAVALWSLQAHAPRLVDIMRRALGA